MNLLESILVIVTRRIGDVLLTTPLIGSLRSAWPDATIDILVYRGTETCIEANPDITAIHIINEEAKISEQISFIRSIMRRYDLALSVLPGDRPVFYSVLAGKRRFALVERGVKHFWKRLLLTGWKAFDNRDTHTVLMNLALADCLAIHKRYHVVASWTEEQEDRLFRLLPCHRGKTHYAVIHPCPQFRYKMWRAGAWSELARTLADRGFHIVVTGSADRLEQCYLEDILPLLPSATTNLSGRLSLNEVACLLKGSDLYVGPDTSVTHLAAAVGTPTVALYGPTNPVKWGPWPSGHRSGTNPWRRRGTPQQAGNVVLLQGTQECVPCGEEGCDRCLLSESRCLQSITVGDVMEAVAQILPAEM